MDLDDRSKSMQDEIKASHDNRGSHIEYITPPIDVQDAHIIHHYPNFFVLAPSPQKHQSRIALEEMEADTIVSPAVRLNHIASRSTLVLTDTALEKVTEAAVVDEVAEEMVIDEVAEEMVQDEVAEEIGIDEVAEEAVQDEVAEETVVDEVMEEAAVDEVATEMLLPYQRTHHQFAYPAWPTSKPGPQETLPLPGQKPHPTRTDQMIYECSDQERGMSCVPPPMQVVQKIRARKNFPGARLQKVASVETGIDEVAEEMVQDEVAEETVVDEVTEETVQDKSAAADDADTVESLAVRLKHIASQGTSILKKIRSDTSPVDHREPVESQSTSIPVTSEQVRPGILARMNSWKLPNWLETILVIGILAGSFAVHAINMFNYPHYEQDEGTYLMYAWAVTRGMISPYAYGYGHPPLAWIQIAGWVQLTGGFSTFGNALNSGRVLMLLIAVAATLLVYLIARHLGASFVVCLLGGAFFAFSPLSITFQRELLLDNFAAFWFLVSLYLIIRGKSHLFSIVGAALSFGISLLSKEVVIILFPLMVYVVWLYTTRFQRKFTLVSC